jgi:16S rRNA (cytosine967-C5)-methyltransferase
MMGNDKKNPRRVAAEILAKWETGSQKIDTLRDDFLKDGDNWDDRDRALVTEITYGVVRKIASIDQELEEYVDSGLAKMQHNLLSILRVGLYQIRHLDRVPTHAVVNEAVEHARAWVNEKASGLVNAVLRRALRDSDRRPVDAFYIDGHQLNKWRFKWLEKFGEEKTDQLIRYFETVPEIGLRRNLLKTSSDEEWQEILKAEGVDFHTIDGFPGFVYAKKVRPSELKSFQDGITTVQDPATAISVRALDPQPGEKILDLCCAPGGKTAHIWEKMEGKGQLVAVDKHMKRNKMTREGLNRLGHEGVQVLSDDIMKMTKESYDRVLIDVPCSGTGVAHRRPDLLTNRSPLKIAKYGQIQRSLINHASQMVKVGGVLVYSTCSLETEENEMRVQGFNKKYPGDFVLESLSGDIPEGLVDQKGWVRTWPPSDNIDGAFVARWRRVK